MMNRKAAPGWEGETLDALKQRWDRPNVHLYASIDSTNTRAKELAAEGAPAGTIVLADEQTAGRGLAGRRWFSPKGTGLYLSLILRPETLPNPTLMPLLAGLGLVRAVEDLLGASIAVGLKWPNDLIVQDRKAGGVLSEAVWAEGRPSFVVLGIGINVKQDARDFPSALRDVATSLQMASETDISRLELADGALREVEARCVDPPAALDSEELDALDKYDWLRDRRCSVQESEESELLPGVAVGIAPDGALLFRPDRGALRRITSGRVIPEELQFPDY